MVTIVGTIVGLLVIVVALVSLAQRINQPYPIVLVVGGLVLALIPGLPQVVLDPNLVLLLFLPPLVYGTAWFTSWRDFRTNLRSISLLAIGLVIATTLLVGFVGHLLGLSWAAAFVLGAIVSPTDTVAATSLSQQLRLPRSIIAVVEGESLVNDATGLIVYRFAVAAVATGVFSLGQAAGQFVFASIGGVIIGLAVGVVGAYLHQRIRAATTGIALSFLLPFVAYLPATAMQASGVLAVATAGIYLGSREATLFTSTARLQANGVWDFLTFMLNSILFILLGFQLRSILTLTPRITLLELIGAGLLLGIIVMGIRLAWVFPGSWLSWKLGIWLQQPRVKPPAWRRVTVVGWLGMRGVVSLAAALALPLGIPDRDRILFLTFAIIMVTLLVQGLSAPLVVRWLHMPEDTSHQQEHQLTQRALAQAGLDHLATLNGAVVGVKHIDHLRTQYTKRLSLADDQETTTLDKLASMRQLKIALLDAQRTAVLQLRDEGSISDEVLHETERDLDYEEVRIRSGEDE